MRRLIALAAVMAFVFAGLSAVGQNPDYPILLWSVSSIDPEPSECVEQVAAVRNALRDLDLPAARKFNRPVSREFSWVVICNEQTWFHLKNSVLYARVNTRSSMTDFTNHVVFLHGFERTPNALRDTVAHEMGHMLCECADEAQAEHWKGILLHDARQKARRPEAEVAAVSR
jgi:sarcosine oxidase delta subunit